MRTKDFVAFIKEREAVRLRRAAGAQKPWTTDPILQKYRFCNVHREDDAVTQWIAKNWRTPMENDNNVWFLMVVARLINLPMSLTELTKISIQKTWNYKTAQVVWRPEAFISVLHTRRAMEEQVFNSAYIVSTNGRAMDKVEYLAQHVLTPLWESRAVFKPSTLVHGKLLNAPLPRPLDNLYDNLSRFNGMGSFMAAQVVADVKYTPPYLQAADWWSFAASGPGSRRGLNRVSERAVDASWPGATWLAALEVLSQAVKPLLEKAGVGRLHNQDLQNCLCEFDKYERVRLGEGRPRSTYPGV